jgi:hypothetical protein
MMGQLANILPHLVLEQISILMEIIPGLGIFEDRRVPTCSQDSSGATTSTGESGAYARVAGIMP